MSIERRRTSRHCYVTAVHRVNGRLRKRYIGPARDPVVELFVRSKKLDDAHLKHRRSVLRHEIAASAVIEQVAEQITTWSASWSALRKICEIVKGASIAAEATMKDAKSGTPLPGLHQFQRICELANAGDQDASRQLDGWIAAFPALTAEANDLLTIAREQIIASLGAGSAEAEALLRKRIDQQRDDLYRTIDDDLLGKLFADAVLLVWMDFMRCQVSATRQIDDTKSAKYWDAAADRAARRWRRIVTAFTQHSLKWRRHSSSRGRGDDKR